MAIQRGPDGRGFASAVTPQGWTESRGHDHAKDAACSPGEREANEAETRPERETLS